MCKFCCHRVGSYDNELKVVFLISLFDSYLDEGAAVNFMEEPQTQKLKVLSTAHC